MTDRELAVIKAMGYAYWPNYDQACTLITHIVHPDYIDHSDAIKAYMPCALYITSRVVVDAAKDEYLYTYDVYSYPSMKVVASGVQEVNTWQWGGTPSWWVQDMTLSIPEVSHKETKTVKVYTCKRCGHSYEEVS